MDRATKESALGCQAYVEERLQSRKNDCEQAPNGLSEPLLIELEGCEIRTGTFAPAEGDLQYGQLNRNKVLTWRDIRVGLARPVSADSKLYVARVEGYPEVMSLLFSVATMLGMTEQTDVVAVADGGQGLREELENQFSNMQFIIGSGEVESAHRFIPQQRLKLPGASWYPDWINPMLALRVIRANGWWDDYWTQRSAATKMAA